MKQVLARSILLIALIAAVTLWPSAQSTMISGGSSLPAKCIAGRGVYLKTGTGAGAYWCSATDTWTAIGGGSGAMTLITETVTAGSQATVSFTSIPNSYRDLRLVVRGRGDTSASSVVLRVTFNNDGSAIYDYSKSDFNGSASAGGSGGQAVAQTSADVGYLSAATSGANAASSCELWVYDYKGTTFTKTARSWGTLNALNSITNQFMTNGFVAYRSTSAITRADVSLSAGHFVDGSVASLYGAN